MKKLMTMIAGASAFALTAAADAPSWFQGGIESGWPTTAVGGAWDNVGDHAYDANINGVEVDADTATPLTFKAASTNDMNGACQNATINATVKFVPFTTLPTLDGTEKAAVAVLKETSENCFYGIRAAGQSGNEWFKLDNAVQPYGGDDIAVGVTFVKDSNGTKIVYTVGATECQPVDINMDGLVSTVSIAGSGELYALNGEKTIQQIQFSKDAAALTAKHLSCVVSNATEGSVLNEFPASVNYGDHIVCYFTPDYGYKVTDGNTVVDFGGLTAATGVSSTTVQDITVQQAFFQIGTELYLTLAEATAAAANTTETIEMLADYTGPFWANSAPIPANTFTNGTVTIDLGGKTWTAMPSSSKAAALENAGIDGSLKFRNGMIVLANTCKTITYGYLASLEFDGVTIDATDMVADTPGFSDTRKFTAFIQQNGVLILHNGTTVDLPNNANLVTFLDRAGSQYSFGESIIDVNSGEFGNVKGNIFMCSEGSLSLGSTTVLAGNIYVGSASYSGYTDDKAPAGYAARVGAIRGAAMGGDGSQEVTAVLYKNFSDAWTAVNANPLAAPAAVREIALLQDYAGDDLAYTVAAGVKFDLGGHTFAPGFAANNGTIVVYDGNYINLSGTFVSGAAITNNDITVQKGCTCVADTNAAAYVFSYETKSDIAFGRDLAAGETVKVLNANVTVTGFTLGIGASFIAVSNDVTGAANISAVQGYHVVAEPFVDGVTAGLTKWTTAQDAVVVNFTIANVPHAGLSDVIISGSSVDLENIPATLTEGQTYRVEWYVEEGYQFGADNGICSGTVGKSDITATIATPTVIVTSYTITYDSGVAPQQYSESDSETILATPADRVGVTFDGWTNDYYTVAITSLVAHTTGNISLFAKWTPIVAPDWPADPTSSDVAGHAAGDIYGNIPEALVLVDAGKLAAWAKDPNKGNVNFGERNEILPEAFLLDCANTAQAVADAKAAFGITSITIVDGAAVIAPADASAYGNGKIEIRGATSVNGPYAKGTENATFFKAFLVADPVSVK